MLLDTFQMHIDKCPSPHLWKYAGKQVYFGVYVCMYVRMFVHDLYVFIV